MRADDAKKGKKPVDVANNKTQVAGDGAKKVGVDLTKGTSGHMYSV